MRNEHEILLNEKNSIIEMLDVKQQHCDEYEKFAEELMVLLREKNTVGEFSIRVSICKVTAR